LKNYHTCYCFFAEALLFIEKAQSKSFSPFVDENRSSKTENAHHASLQSYSESLEESVNGHARLQDKWLPVYSLSLLNCSFLVSESFLLCTMFTRRVIALKFIIVTVLPHLYTLLAVYILTGANYKGDLILMVVGLADQYFIEPHDENESDHGDDHREWKFTLVDHRSLVLQ
jgi:hypothetical protein